MLLRHDLRNLPAGFINNEVDRLFNSALSGFPLTRSCPEVFPLLNVWENAEGLCIEAEMPGVEQADLEVTLHGRELLIRGERRSAKPEQAQYHCREQSTGKFARVIQLPEGLETEKAEAKLKNGIFTLLLPKGSAAKPRRIEVQKAD